MDSLKTVNVLIVTTGVLLTLGVLIVAIWFGNNHAATERTRQITACANAGNLWVQGDCIPRSGPRPVR